MTVYESGVPSLTQYAVLRLASLAKKRARKQSNIASTRVNAVANALIRIMLHLAGFALLTIAAGQWNIIAGYAVAGISCFVFSTLMAGGNPDAAPDPTVR